MQELKPMTWPRPTPLLYLRDDYGQVIERVRKYGRLDIAEDISEAGSERYGRSHYGSHRYEGAVTFRQPQPRRPTLAERLQVEHEAEAYKRQRAKEEAADAEWTAAEKAARAAKRRAALEARARAHAEVEQALVDAKAAHEAKEHATARAYWAKIDPEYTFMTYHNVAIGTSGVLCGVEFLGGKTYLVPRAIAKAITGRDP